MNILAYNYVSWRLTTLAKLSVDVSHVFSHELSRKGLQLSFSRRFSVKLMYTFNSAAIFPPGHPYIESTTVLSDNTHTIILYVQWTGLYVL